MRAFAALMETLVLTPSRNRKLEAMVEYFRTTPDPDRGIGLAILTGALTFKNVKPAVLRDVVLAEVDPHLFALSYDFVGDLGETIALIWPHHASDISQDLPLSHRPLSPEGRGGDGITGSSTNSPLRSGERVRVRGSSALDTEPLPSLPDLVELFNMTSKAELPRLIGSLLTRATINERWALVKFATGALRIGVSARLAKTALSEMSGKDLQQIEEVWNGLTVPYTELFSWLDGKTERPDIDHASRFHPLMLSNPIDEEKDLDKLDPRDFVAEWKWDGIRVQLIAARGQVSLFSRTGDDIAEAFPDVTGAVFGDAVLDGELLVGQDFQPALFNDLQQRLNRRTALGKHLTAYPAFIRVYDMLFDGSDDIRALPWTERRARLEAWFEKNPQTRLDLSPTVPFESWDELAEIRRKGAAEQGHEGVMLKLRSSVYVPGRPKGLWFKWKRDPNVVDAILMYAQRGHGKRSSFYSDYTFGVWKGNEIVPIGKAYFGFTDEELKQLDKWVRNNTVAAFGPVREVTKELVFEVAFDSAQQSTRHKSGVALRFPRINRIRWDKPAREAATLDEMQVFLTAT